MIDYEHYYAGKTVLVTGGAGAIGSNLSRRLAGLGRPGNHSRRPLIFGQLERPFDGGRPLRER